MRTWASIARRTRRGAVCVLLLVALVALAGAPASSAQEGASIRLLDGNNVALDPATAALAPSLRLPNDASLARGLAHQVTSDARDVRIELVLPGWAGDVVRATIESIDTLGTTRHELSAVELRRGEGDVFRSPFLRLVTSELDAEAPDVEDRVLRVALGDRVRVQHEAAGIYEIRVGRPPGEPGALAERRARLRVRVVRSELGGRPAIGGDDLGAIALAREQVAIANEIWAQCLIGFGDPLDLDLAVVDPPGVASLLSVGDVDGLEARGGGVIRLRAGGRAIHPVPTRAGARPVDTALDVAAALRRLGLVARVFENERAESGAHRSADVVVRRRDGRPVALAPDGAAPLSSDARQRVLLGEVDLADGVREFDDMTALTGTLEERALIRALADEDDATIDVLVIPELTGGTRFGEAFVSGDPAGAPGSIANVVLVSREGVAQGHAAFTLAHELGHVLLDLALHPDHIGPDRPWLLMDSDASDSTLRGPRRLTERECERARSWPHLE